jgi:uncharacterized protein YjiS (DUF1127 family)
MLMKPNQYELDASALSPPARARPNLLTRIVKRLETYAEYKRQQRALLALDDHLLKDIGIGRAEAERLAATPFNWRDVPARKIR